MFSRHRFWSCRRREKSYIKPCYRGPIYKSTPEQYGSMRKLFASILDLATGARERTFAQRVRLHAEDVLLRPLRRFNRLKKSWCGWMALSRMPCDHKPVLARDLTPVFALCRMRELFLGLLFKGKHFLDARTQFHPFQMGAGPPVRDFATLAWFTMPSPSALNQAARSRRAQSARTSHGPSS